jgi:glycosyltransferase involved in cell wall biosynthesis
MSLPRILYVGTFPPHPGGSSVAAGYLLRVLHESGYPLSVVTPSSAETAGRAELVRRDFPDIELVEVPATRPQISPWDVRLDDPERLAQSAIMQAAVAPAADRHRPDLVFAGREEFLESVLPWATLRNVPVLCRVPSGAELTAGHHNAATCQFALDLIARSDRIISPAHHIAAALANLGHSNIVTIQNPVDTARFYRAPVDRDLAARLGLKPEHVVVAHASNLKPIKRVCDIAAAAALAVVRDPRLIFLIIGDGPDRAKLEKAIIDGDLADHFRFTGWVNHAACGAYLRLADMALMPSTMEGLASAYLEAMATGLPLLASDVTGAREVVDHGESGFLFPVGDVDAIADLIVKLAADPDLRHRIGTNARAYVEQNHRLEAVGDLLREVVADVVRQGRAVVAT